MVRASVTALAGAALVSAVCLVPGQASASASIWPPGVMAALGDSISAGFNACGWYVKCTSRSWSAGDHADVDSHYLRLRRADGQISGHNLNLAKPGATSAELAVQVREAIERHADYVTILIGAQDACVDDEAGMTPVAAYRRNIGRALDLLRTGAPQARVFIASIPDIKRLWRVGKDNAFARTFWSVGRICQAMLARPTSTARADQARRDRVRARVIAYNDALADACKGYGVACRFDGNALFTYPFTLSHISKWDFFHPNVTGQRAIASRTAAALHDWPLPVPLT
ncbi:GDSL-type esterase/lipase family protein [Streptosporangium soli]|nr:GDSL-type esterase/lipase family protein [Streptosporangium sp. KLBMP 9127]